MYILNLYKEQFIDIPISEVFKFFENPNNLERITLDNLKFKIKLFDIEPILFNEITLSYLKQ